MNKEDSSIFPLVKSEKEILQYQDLTAFILRMRNEQVMLDRDLAKLYGVETKVLNQAVKRNIARFPDNFRFQLSKDELSNLVTNCDRFATLKHSTTLPYAFTEQGVAMLSAVLKSATAVEVSIRIMEAFISMRRFISQNAGLFQRVELLEKHQRDTEEKIEQVLTRMDELSPAPTTEQLFSTGCVWDAYTFISDLVRSASNRLILIDPFVDERTLLILDKRVGGVECIVHTRYREQVELDFLKHNQQCAPIQRVQLPQAVHDRYLIVDEEVWLLGASVKDMGRSLCTIILLSFTPDEILKRI